MFNIRFKGNIYHVYSVKSDEKGTFVLIYCKTYWRWVNIDDCTPLNNLT